MSAYLLVGVTSRRAATERRSDGGAMLMERGAAAVAAQRDVFRLRSQHAAIHALRRRSVDERTVPCHALTRDLRMQMAQLAKHGWHPAGFLHLMEYVRARSKPAATELLTKFAKGQHARDFSLFDVRGTETSNRRASRNLDLGRSVRGQQCTRVHRAPALHTSCVLHEHRTSCRSQPGGNLFCSRPRGIQHVETARGLFNSRLYTPLRGRASANVLRARKKARTLHRGNVAAADGPTKVSGVASIAAASALGLAVSCSYWDASTMGDGAGDLLSGAAAEMERSVASAYKYKAAETAIPRLPMCRWQLSQYLIDCITAERFAAEFHNKKTVIISGVVTERELRSWSLDAVIAEHGRASLAMTIGGALPVNEGGGAAVRIALESARTRMLADPRLVVFDTSTTPDAARIAAQVPTPVVIADAISSGANEALWKPFFSMMAPGLGLPTHRHGETWSVLLDGR